MFPPPSTKSIYSKFTLVANYERNISKSNGIMKEKPKHPTIQVRFLEEEENVQSERKCTKLADGGLKRRVIDCICI
jgi:hypothetical protein